MAFAGSPVVHVDGMSGSEQKCSIKTCAPVADTLRIVRLGAALGVTRQKEHAMYGKWFDSAYTGSMYGAGAPVFAVMAYAVAHADKESFVELNPIYLAGVIGMSVSEAEQAIEFLCKPDPRSRNPVEEGRRLIHQSAFSYLVVSRRMYCERQNGDDVRTYFRVKQAESRAKKRGKDVKDSQRQSKTIKDSQEKSNHIDVDIDVDIDKSLKDRAFLKEEPRRANSGTAPAARPFFLSPYEEELHDHATYVRKSVQNATGETEHFVGVEIENQAKHTMRADPSAKAEDIADGMIHNWKKYTACCMAGKISHPMEARKFFSSPKWKDKTQWGFRKGMNDSGIEV
jgi:hypothetical protein